MKRSEELKIQRTQKIADMQAIIDGAKEGEVARSLNTEETTRYDALKREVTELDTQIEQAEFVEARSTQEPQKRSFNIGGKADKTYNVSKAIRQFSDGGASKLDGLEAEQHQELSRGVKSNGLLIPYHQRAVADTTTNAANIDLSIAPGISIIGKEPLYQAMGCTIMQGLQGSFKLAKKAADVAGEFAEKAAITTKPAVPTYVTMTPSRIGMTETWDKELLVQENPLVHAAMIADMVKGVDRKITAKTYATALLAATEVPGVALTVAGFNALMAAVDTDGAFAMDRASFFAAKAVPVDEGSGKFLTALTGKNGIGVTYDGAGAFYSTLFDDGAAKQYILYGAWSEIFIGMWGALEMLFDPYTLQEEGQVRTTVNKLTNIVCRNDAAFKRSPDLDATT